VSSVMNEMELELILKDPVAIQIVNNIPTDQRNEVIEKYIILGDMVVSHASIATRKETVEEFFSPLKTDIELIRKQLQQIVPTVAKPAKKGKMTVEAIFNSFREHFMDDSFEDVSAIGKYSDILATTGDTETPILIELKDYTNDVPSAEIDKFWRDMERRGTRYGIFISMRSGITKCSSCINLKTRMEKIAIFVVNSELNWAGHLFAHYVIKKLIELESMKKKELKGEELSKVLTKINGYVLELQKNTAIINKIQTIADGLKTTCKNRLDELISLSNEYTRKQNEKTNDILEEISKVEI
jgi:hypothetical protein